MSLRATTLVKRALRSTLPRRLNNDAKLSVLIRPSLTGSSSTLLSSPWEAIAANSPGSTRHFTTVPPGLRAYPQYTVFAETCMLTLKTMMPQYRIFQGKTAHIAVESSSKRGRIILELIPRGGDAKAAYRERALRFALSPEECGFLVDQLPKNEAIVLLRRAQPNPDQHAPVDVEMPDKVLHITPGQGGMVSFKIDFELNGVGGQEPIGQKTEAVGPLEVVVQAGEFQVMMSLIRSSIPHLVGWTTTMDVATQWNIQEAIERSPPRGGDFPQAGGGGPRGFSSSEEGDLI